MLHILLLLVNISLLLGEPLTCSTSVSPGSITYSGGTGNLIQAGGTGSGKWGTVTTSGSQITAGLGPRWYLANGCQSAFSLTAFDKINPLGSTITFTVDLATAGCGTNAAFYLVNMPAAQAGSNGDYYCDANGGSGNGDCTEMDLMEANRHALQITAHKCTSPTSGCDGGGCARNTQSIANGYGPSSSYTINTQNSFTVAITFTTSSGQLTTITSKISQSGKSITLTHDSSCGSGYLAAMDAAFSSGMVPVWSFWSGGMSWLDSPACSSETNEESNSQFVFSNLQISGAGSVAPPPPPPPPPPPGTQTCGTSSGTNLYWVEFFAPSSVSTTTASTTAASVSCSNPTDTYACSWYASGGKFQCNPSPNECNNPVPIFGGKSCPFPASEVADANAQSNSSLDIGTIAGIAAGCVVVAVVLIVVVVIAVKKHKHIEEHV